MRRRRTRCGAEANLLCRWSRHRSSSCRCKTLQLVTEELNVVKDISSGVEVRRKCKVVDRCNCLVKCKGSKTFAGSCQVVSGRSAEGGAEEEEQPRWVDI